MKVQKVAVSERRYNSTKRMGDNSHGIFGKENHRKAPPNMLSSSMDAKESDQTNVLFTNSNIFYKL